MKDEARFNDFYNRHFNPMVDRVMKKVSNGMNWATAEEIVQETMLVAAQKWDSAEAETDKEYRAWVFGVLNNKVLHYLRNRVARGRQVEQNINTQDDLDNKTIDNDTPENSVEEAEQAARIRGAMATLDHDIRKTFDLYMSGEKMKDIALALGVEKSTVATRIHRARAHIRAALNTDRMIPPEMIDVASYLNDDFGPEDGSCPLTPDRFLKLDRWQWDLIFRNKLSADAIVALEQNAAQRAGATNVATIDPLEGPCESLRDLINGPNHMLSEISLHSDTKHNYNGGSPMDYLYPADGNTTVDYGSDAVIDRAVNYHAMMDAGNH